MSCAAEASALSMAMQSSFLSVPALLALFALAPERCGFSAVIRSSGGTPWTGGGTSPDHCGEGTPPRGKSKMSKEDRAF